MPVYDQGKSDTDGRGLARAIDGIRHQLRASARVTAAGNVSDPTPPPAEVEPGSITRLSNEKGYSA